MDFPNPTQLFSVKNNYNLERINKILKIKLNNYEELTMSQYKQLLITPSKFNLNFSDVPIEIDLDYEYGITEEKKKENKILSKSNTPEKYINFHDFLILKYDNLSWDEIKHKLKPYRELMHFQIYQKIYQTYQNQQNIFYVFIMSEIYPYNSNVTTTLMSELGCPKQYILSVYRNGYKIKSEIESDKINSKITHLCEYGNKKLLHEKCNRLIQVFDKFISKFCC
jgi:hypothetical protein